MLNTIPAVVGTLLGLVAAWLTSSIAAFLLVQALGYLSAIILERRSILATLRRRRAPAVPPPVGADAAAARSATR